MAKHVDESFVDQRVVIDGEVFEQCTFTRCRLVFRGGPPMHLISCRIDNCRFEFDDAAARTVQFMTALYHHLGPTGKQVIEATFENIRRGRSDSPPAAEPGN